MEPVPKRIKVEKFEVEFPFVQEFVTAIGGFNALPNLTHVLIKFHQQNGMTMYAAPDNAIVAVFHLDRGNFPVFNCPDNIQMWVAKERLNILKHNLNLHKNVLNMKITELVDPADGTGITFSGTTGTNGDLCFWTFNLYEHLHNNEPVDMVHQYDLHLTLSSQNADKNIKFIHDSCDFIQLSLENSRLVYKGVSNVGMVSESIYNTVASDTPDLKFERMLNKRFLKAVQETSGFNKTVTMSVDVNNELTPLLFHYDLGGEHESFFKIWVMPCEM